MNNLYEYENLIERFLNGIISVKEFERAYIDKYTNDNEPKKEDLFQILDWLFFQVDAFTDLPMEPGDNPEDYINEEQLRESAAETLQALRALKES